MFSHVDCNLITGFITLQGEYSWWRYKHKQACGVCTCIDIFIGITMNIN